MVKQILKNIEIVGWYYKRSWRIKETIDAIKDRIQ